MIAACALWTVVSTLFIESCWCCTCMTPLFLSLSLFKVPNLPFISIVLCHNRCGIWIPGKLGTLCLCIINDCHILPFIVLCKLMIFCSGMSSITNIHIGKLGDVELVAITYLSISIFFFLFNLLVRIMEEIRSRRVQIHDKCYCLCYNCILRRSCT